MILTHYPKSDFLNKTVFTSTHGWYKCKLKDRMFCDDLELSLWFYDALGEKIHLKTYKTSEAVYRTSDGLSEIWWLEYPDSSTMLFVSYNGWVNVWTNRKDFVDKFYINKKGKISYDGKMTLASYLLQST